MVCSDTHTGHHYGLTPPEWWFGKDSGDRLQRDIGEYQRDLWGFTADTIERLKPIDILLMTGDAIDGKGEKSGGVEQLTTDRVEQCRMLARFIDETEAEKVRMVYGCLTAGHKILKSDLSWANVETLRPGDDLLAFDENENEVGGRRFCSSKVLMNQAFKDEVYDLILSDGSKITANGEHPFLMRRGGRKYEWVKVEHLYKIAHPSTPGFGKNGLSEYMPMPFPRLLPVWDNENSYQAGYLAGFFDGEGCVNQPVKRRGRGEKFSDEHGFKISAAQKKNAALSFTENCLDELGFQYSTLNASDRDVYNIAILGGSGQQLRFLGSVRPRRLLKNFRIEKMMSTRSNGEKSNLKLIDIRKAGQQIVYGLSTSSKTYISDGFMSHNTRYHVGKEDDFESIIPDFSHCKDIKIEGHGFYNVNGCVIDAKHKIGASQIPHGRHTAISRARMWNVMWHNEKARHPLSNIILRGHVHYFNYAGGPSWVGITLPALCYHTIFGVRECEGLVDLGIVWFDIYDSGRFSWDWRMAEFQGLDVEATIL